MIFYPALKNSAAYVPLLMAAALLVGGRAVIDPLLQSAATMREGGSHRFHPPLHFCRRLTFDCGTAVLVEGAVEQ
jgi:hypothetical protein